MIKKIFHLLIQGYVVFAMGKVKYLKKLGVQIGDNCEILTPVINFGSEPWLIKIENNVTITHGVKFITHDASTRLFRKKYKNLNAKFGNKFGCIKVGSNVFIGVNSIIMPGVSIGNDSIIGAGSVVITDVPAREIFAGVPAKKISTLEAYEKKCVANALEIKSNNIEDLRSELTKHFWGNRV